MRVTGVIVLFYGRRVEKKDAELTEQLESKWKDVTIDFC